MILKVTPFPFSSLSLGAHYSQATNDAVEQAMALGIHFSIAGT
jgi:hypothetical protein